MNRGDNMSNELLKNALKALQGDYSRILLINRKLNTYCPIIIEENETKWDTIGKLTDFANWFLRNGNIYEADKPLFRNFIDECFVQGKQRYLFYRRKADEGYRWAYLFIKQGTNPKKPNEEFLFVRDCNEIYIEQCDLILDSVGYCDPLTGLKNRLAFNAEQREEDEVNFVTITGLGAINAEEGYDAGNERIATVASILEKYTDDVYRITGSKFALRNVKNLPVIKVALGDLAIVE